MAIILESERIEALEGAELEIHNSLQALKAALYDLDTVAFDPGIKGVKYRQYMQSKASRGDVAAKALDDWGFSAYELYLSEKAKIAAGETVNISAIVWPAKP